jgi:deoxyribose-phosphate aldolase
MNYSTDQIAAALDLAVLKPAATAQDVKDACALANKHKIKSVCVALSQLPLAASLFDNVSVVIGFPHGNTCADIKYREAKFAIEYSAKEIDVVLNYGKFLDGNRVIIDLELSTIVAVAHRSGLLVKAILETCYYTPKQIVEMGELCCMYGVDFVKTSTGFAGDVTPEAVESLKKAVKGTDCQIKASGGIKTYADVCQYLDMGCTRLGASTFLGLLP